MLPNDAPRLEMVKFRVIGKKYSAWRAIFCEAHGNSDTILKLVLWDGFRIRIPKDQDPMVYITDDTNQRRELSEAGVINPTFCQLLTSTKVVALSEQGAIDDMTAILEELRIK